MNEQPTSLRLADELLDGMSDEHWNQLNADAAAELRRLHAENIELKAKADVAKAGYLAAVSKACWQESTNRELNRHIEQKVQLRAKNEALRADAERYRWLRQYNTAKHPTVTEAFFLGDGHLDAAIDAERSKT